MRRFSDHSLLLAIGASLLLAGGCGQKSAAGGGSYTPAQLEAGKAKEIKKVQDDKTIPEGAKTAIIESIRAKDK